MVNVYHARKDGLGKMDNALRTNEINLRKILSLMDNDFFFTIFFTLNFINTFLL